VNKIVGFGGVIFIGLGCLCLAAYAYFIYAPLPNKPNLPGHAATQTIRVEGHVRSYIEYVPAQLPPDAPLIIVLHGSLMNGKMMRRMSGYEFDKLADKNHFAVLYPDGYKHDWNDCRKADTDPARLEHIDDVGFMRALIAKEKARRKIDSGKVYVVGYSNGGQMAMAIAQQSQSPAAGIAVFGASLPAAGNSICPQSTSTPPVMIVDGTDDPVNPFHGGDAGVLGVVDAGDVKSALATAKEFVNRDDIHDAEKTRALPHRDANDPTWVREFSWSRGGMPYVVLCAVMGGGHTVPQPEYRFPRVLGRTSGNIDGPAAAVAFFLHK
jgi:polyhydroxybutyrate depolymerase